MRHIFVRQHGQEIAHVSVATANIETWEKEIAEPLVTRLHGQGRLQIGYCDVYLRNSRGRLLDHHIAVA